MDRLEEFHDPEISERLADTGRSCEAAKCQSSATSHSHGRFTVIPTRK
jgi:hypothetical protein